CFMRGPRRTSPIPAASKTMETAAGTWTSFSSFTVAWVGPIFATSSFLWYVKTGCTSPTTPKTKRMTPRMTTKRFMDVNLSQTLISEPGKHADTPLHSSGAGIEELRDLELTPGWQRLQQQLSWRPWQRSMLCA